MTTFRKAGRSAVITGGASGIGLAAAKAFLADGMKVLIADRDADALDAALHALKPVDGGEIHAHRCDVSQFEEVEGLRDAAAAALGPVHCLMNNAGVGVPTRAPWEGLDALHGMLGVNLMGVIHGCHAFIPGMLAHGEPGVVINTGSKQGITRPPGNYGYNLSKAGVLAYTESVAHALRNVEGGRLTAHLLAPGFVYTSMVSRFIPEKPPMAWTAEETVAFALPRIEAGDFYVICPDNEVTREMDERRIQWNADDLIQNRPALSRWHPDYQEAFARFMKS
ncbi:MAG: SDR family NAD(P)-dependent oxidoreductase [Pseudomonadota bacterium]